MLLEDILESNYLYCQQNTLVPFLICSVVLLYPETGNILEIFYEFVSDILKNVFSSNQLYRLNNCCCFTSKLVAPNKTN
jgi:hypothetical protein